MEIRSSVSDTKTQPESQHDITVAVRIAELQKSFMETTGNCVQIEEFYVKQIEPLFKQKEPYKDLKQINTQFAEIIQLFGEIKSIDADIVEGYRYVLMLYQFFVCFQFLQIKKNPSSSRESTATLPTLPTSATLPISPTLSTSLISPTSPALPTSLTSPNSPKSPDFTEPEERKFSTEFTEIQSASAQRNLLVYKTNLKKWSDTPFSFSKMEWKEKADDLNKAINFFNQELKALSASGFTREEKTEANEIEILFKEEQNFAVFSQNIQEMTLKQQQLVERCDSFRKDRDTAILLLKQRDVIYCKELKAGGISLEFSREEKSQLLNTREIQGIVSLYYDLNRKKKSEIKALQDKLALLTIPFSQQNVLGKLLMRNRIFALLRRFKAVLEFMFGEYNKTLQENWGGTDEPKKLDINLKVEIKAIKRCFSIGIKKEIKGKIASLKKEAILYRKERRINHVEELKSQLMILSMDDISSLNETQKDVESQLDIKWVLEIERIIKNYRNNFIIITNNITDIEDREKIQEKINELTNFYQVVERERSHVVSRANDLNCPRQDKIAKFFLPFSKFMQDIAKIISLLEIKWIEKKIKLYFAKYNFFMALEPDEKISGLQKLLQEIQIFQKEKNFEDCAIKRLEKLTADINLEFFYDTQEKEKNRAEVKALTKNMLSQITAKPGASVDILQNAKAKLVVLKNQGAASVRNELRKQGGKGSIEQRLRCIQKPISRFEKDITNIITNHPVPKYSCFWATVWSVILPCVGYCIYQWWYDRNCRLARECHIKKELERIEKSENTSHEGSVTNSPAEVLQTIFPKNNKFTTTIEEDKSTSSSVKMTRVMHSLRLKTVKKQRNDDYIRRSFEVQTAQDRIKSKSNKSTAKPYTLKRSATGSPSQYQHNQEIRQHLYYLTSPIRNDSSSSSPIEEGGSNFFTVLDKTSLPRGYG